MNNPIVKFSEVSKKYGAKLALDNVSFEIERGSIVGLVGGNGAGKTTIIKLSNGLIKASTGSIYIDGHDVKKNYEKVLEVSTTVYDRSYFYQNLSGLDNLFCYARGFGYKKKEQLLDIAKEVGLEERIEDNLSTYSFGMEQRLNLAKVLIAKPKLVFMDEPFNGLDIDGMRDLRKMIVDINKTCGTTFIISTHLLAEIENLCNYVLFLQDGRVVKNAEIGESICIEISDLDCKRAMELLKKSGIELSLNESTLKGAVPFESIKTITKILGENFTDGYSLITHGLMEDLYDSVMKK